MKTDRELLELAAKAAGMIVLVEGVEWPREKIGWFFNQVGDNQPALHNRASSALTMWAPLTDDGDALRLAVTLGLCVTVDNGYTTCSRQMSYFKAIEWDNDKLGATRYAIVSVAASIGRKIS